MNIYKFKQICEAIFWQLRTQSLKSKVSTMLACG